MTLGLLTQNGLQKTMGIQHMTFQELRLLLLHDILVLLRKIWPYLGDYCKPTLLFTHPLTHHPATSSTVF